MKLAIMQPYLFPYLGYWQLLNTVDHFVIYDDVNYIKKGWVNRNRILINSAPGYIRVPLVKASQNKRICDLSIDSSLVWRNKLVKTIGNTYGKAPFFTEIFPVIEKILCHETDNLADYLAHQLITLTTFLGIKTKLIVSSRCYENSSLRGQDRILDICTREGATTYINPQGGRALYDIESFRRANINLRFIVLRSIPYKQRSAGFAPYLSIIDALMEIGPTGVEQHLGQFDLITGESPHAQ